MGCTASTTSAASPTGPDAALVAQPKVPESQQPQAVTPTSAKAAETSAAATAPQPAQVSELAPVPSAAEVEALSEQLFQAVAKKDEAKVAEIVRNPAKVCGDEGTPTALAAAVQLGELGIVKLLVEAGARVTETNLDLCANALHTAAEFGHFGVVDYLLRSTTIDPNTANKVGGTPLLLASFYGRSTRVVELLLGDPRVDVNKTTPSGTSALQAAKEKGHTDIVQLIERKLQSTAGVPPVAAES